MSYKAFVFFTCFFMAAMMPLRNIASAAEKYTIKEMTPEVMSALENRRSRYDELAELKQQGKVGENNRGYVEAFSDAGDVQKLVDAENRDRKIIYQTIAEQNNLREAIGTIERIFAQTQRDNAEPGGRIQTEDGRWTVK